MPTPILFNIPSSTATNIAIHLAGQQIAKSRGAQGIRFPVGVDSMGVVPNTSRAYLAAKTAAEHNFDFIRPIFGYGPSNTGSTGQAIANAFNGGSLWSVRNRPPRGPDNALWNWIWDVVWTQLFTALRQGAIAGGKATDEVDSFIVPEWFNEPGRGGVGGPHIGGLGDNNYPPPYNTLLSGEIEPDFFEYAYYIVSRVNWHGCQCVALNFEGAGNSEAQREVNSVTGEYAEDLLTLPEAAYIGTNRYSDPVLAPYDSAAVKAAYSTKLGEQRTRVLANSLMSAKTFTVGEFGIHKDRVPRCVAPNFVRNDLIEQVQDQVGVAHAAYFIAVPPSASSASIGQVAYSYDPSNGASAPYDNVHLVVP